MKKILCLILCLVSIVSCCSMTISAAAEEVTPSVESELAGITIDGKLFNEADYPVDAENANKYVITVVEDGFNNISSSPAFGLYIYVYNPNCEEIGNVAENSVQIGVNMQTGDYYYYSLSRMSVSSDNRFLKFQVQSRGVVNVSTLYTLQEKNNERVYDIVTLRLYTNGALTSYEVKKSFLFAGYGFDNSLSCEKFDLSALDVTIYPTNWISPNAGTKVDGSASTIYDHYEINSVYFTVPESYFADGMYLASIRAIYDRLRLTPIIVTNSTSFNDSEKGKLTKQKIIDGSVVELGGDDDVFDLLFEVDEDWDYRYENWYYSESKLFDSLNKSFVRKDVLAYYFENANLPKDYDFEYGVNSMVAVSAEELQAYFYERYNNPEYDNSKLYSEKIPFTVDYTAGKMLEMSTFTHDMSKFAQWYYKAFVYENDSYLFEDFNAVGCEEFQVIGNSGVYNLDYYASISEDNYAAVADSLYIGQNDMSHFVGVCENAKANNERVVLLRFGFSDYRCVPLYDAWEFGIFNLDYYTQVGYAVEKYAYMGVNVARMVFQNNVQTVIVPVFSNTVDSFGDVIIFKDPKEDGSWDSNIPHIDLKFPNLEIGVKNIGKIISVIATLAVILIVIAVFLSVRKRKKNNQNDKSDGG